MTEEELLCEYYNLHFAKDFGICFTELDSMTKERIANTVGFAFYRLHNSIIPISLSYESALEGIKKRFIALRNLWH